MVTTSATEIAAVTGVPANGQRAESGGDDSLFAQLLVDAGASASATAASGGKAANGKANVRTESDIAQSVTPSVDMLALCGMSVSTPAPVPPSPSAPNVEGTDKASADVLADTTANTSAIATDAAAQALAANNSTAVPIPPAPAVQVNTEAGPTTTDSVDGRTPRSTSRADLQWLQGSVLGKAAQVATAKSEPKPGTGADAVVDTDVDAATQLNSQAAQQVERSSGHQMTRQPIAQAAEQSVLQAAQQIAGQAVNRKVTGRDDAIELPVVPDSVAVSTEQQPVVEKLLPQVAPMMGAMSAQLRDDGLDQSREVTANDAQNAIGAVNANSMQPAGTQLASDAPVLEIAPRHHLQATVGSHQWATELGNKLTMMATRDTQSATLYMTPADLGPVQVRIDLNQDQASVWFTAEHAETRSALEQSLPRLREMFTAQGMSLTDAGVFGDRSRQQQAEPSFTSTRFVSSQYEDSEALADTATVRSISLSLLDAYA